MVRTPAAPKPVRLIPAKELTIDEWEAYHKMRLALRERFYPAAAAEAPVRSTETFRERVLSSLETLNGVEHVIWDARLQQVKGWMRFFPQGDHLSAQADYFAERFPDGFIRLVERGIQAEMAHFKLRNAISFTDDPRQIEAFRRMTHVQEVPFHQLSVERAEVNARLLEKWRDGFRSAGSGTTLELAVNYPNEVIEDYISLHSRFLSDLPLGGQTVSQARLSVGDLQKFREVNQRNQQVSLTLFLQDETGRRIGFSEAAAGRETGLALQGMTGLLPEYRGKGFAKALKAEMFECLLKEVPTLRRITTTTSAHNAGMLAINKAMGFQIKRQSAQFTFDLRQMREAVRKSSEKTA